MKRLFIFTFFLILIINFYFASCPIGLSGTGTLADPCQITTCADLQTVKTKLDSNYVLLNDINCFGTNHSQIGTFKGTFDGNNKKIFNLKANNMFAGLFGTTNKATIKNIGLIDVTFTGGVGAGGIIGSSSGGLIENCFVVGTINSSPYVGGLIGNNNSTTIKNSYAITLLFGAITSYVGGLVGRNNDGSIQNSFSVGAIGGDFYDGGLVGRSTKGTVVNSFWDKDVSNLSVSAGGEGKTTQQMKTQNNYTNWNFTNLWKIDEGETYPYFKDNEYLDYSILDFPVYYCNGPIDGNAVLVSIDKNIEVPINEQTNVLVDIVTNRKCEWVCEEGYELGLNPLTQEDYNDLFNLTQQGEDNWYYSELLKRWVWFAIEEDPEEIWFVTDNEEWYYTTPYYIQENILLKQSEDNWIRFENNIENYVVLTTLPENIDYEPNFVCLIKSEEPTDPEEPIDPDEPIEENYIGNNSIITFNSSYVDGNLIVNLTCIKPTIATITISSEDFEYETEIDCNNHLKEQKVLLNLDYEQTYLINAKIDSPCETCEKMIYLINTQKPTITIPDNNYIVSVFLILIIIGLIKKNKK